MSQQRMLRFAMGLAKGLSGPEAALQAGYSGKNRETLQATAGKLVKHPVVVAELERLRGQAEAATHASREEALRKLTVFLRFDPETLLNPDGTLNLPAAKAAGVLGLLEGLEVVEEQREVEGQGVVTTRRAKVKFPDRLGTIDRLAKLCGWNAAEKHQHELTGLAGLEKLLSGLSDAEVEQLKTPPPAPPPRVPARSGEGSNPA
jgi:phage terminase small subunit